MAYNSKKSSRRDGDRNSFRSDKGRNFQNSSHGRRSEHGSAHRSSDFFDDEHEFDNRGASSRKSFSHSKNGRFNSERDFSKGNRGNRQFDTDDYSPNKIYSKKKQLEYQKKNRDLNAPERLNKFIANSGICSRRDADKFIAAGVVSVNGEIVTELGFKVVPSKDKVLFHNQPVKAEKPVYLLLNKPKDCITTTDDPHAKFTVMDIVKNACSERIYPVGRLDRNTTGVLLLTNDGDLAAKLMHPRFDKKKIYEVSLDKDVTPEDMQKLRDGIVLEDGPAQADDIQYVEGGTKKDIGIEIHIGRNRIVRRMFEHLGYKVKKLDRVYFAGLTKKNLPRGKWRFLSDKEIDFLRMNNS